MQSSTERRPLGPPTQYIRIRYSIKRLIHNVFQMRISHGGLYQSINQPINQSINQGLTSVSLSIDSIEDDQLLTGRPPHRPASQWLTVRHAISASEKRCRYCVRPKCTRTCVVVRLCYKPKKKKRNEDHFPQRFSGAQIA